MSYLQPHEVTTLLANVRAGDIGARTQLFRMVYEELRSLAAKLMEDERIGHTLQPTALVNETSIRLLGNLADFQDRRHFFGAASVAMRRVLVDYARGRLCQKRQDLRTVTQLPSGDAGPGVVVDPAFLVALDDSLNKLDTISPRQSEAFHLWYFGGLSIQEVGEMLNVAMRTAQADLKAARTWIYADFCA